HERIAGDAGGKARRGAASPGEANERDERGEQAKVGLSHVVLGIRPGNKLRGRRRPSSVSGKRNSASSNRIEGARTTPRPVHDLPALRDAASDERVKPASSSSGPERRSALPRPRGRSPRGWSATARQRPGSGEPGRRRRPASPAPRQREPAL